MFTTITVVRRLAIAASLGTVAASAVVGARVSSLNAAQTQASSTVEPSSRWLEGLKGKHKQFFDNPSINPVALVHVMNYYDTYNSAFKVKDADINAVLTFYGSTTFYGLTDAV